MKPPLPSRRARPAGPAYNFAKTLAQTVAFWGVFLILIPPVIVRMEHQLCGDQLLFARPWLQNLAIVMFVACGSAGLWSGYIMAAVGRGTPIPFDCPRRLVIAGPYRFIRNPMAVTGLGQGVAVGLYLGSLGVLAYTMAGGIAWNFVVRQWEEHDLEQRFGDEFREYRRHVKCWVPRLTAYTPPAPNR